MHQIELRLDASGHVFVDGERVDVPAGVSPAHAGMQHVLAALGPHGNAEVVGRTPRGQWTMTIVDGQLREHGAEPAPPPPRDAAPAEGAHTAEPSDDTPPSLTRRRALIVTAGAGVLAAVGATSLWALTQPPSRQAPIAPEATVQPLPDGQGAPAGWADTPAWSLPQIADPRPKIAQGTGHSLFVLRQPAGTGELTLVRIDARTGEPSWSAPVGTGLTVLNGPCRCLIDGRKTIAVATDAGLHLWDIDSLRHRVIPLAGTDSPVNIGLAGAWISTGRGSAKAVLGGAWRSCPVGKDATPVGVLDGHLVSADMHGTLWRSAPGAKDAGKAVHLSGPQGWQAGSACAFTPDVLLAAWNREWQMRVVAYDPRTLKPRWISDAHPQWAGFLSTTTLAPSGRWAIIDNRRLDLSTGASSLIASNWKTLAMSDAYAWGSDGAAVLTAPRAGGVQSSAKAPKQSETALIVSGADDLALAVASIGNSSTLYALRRS